MAANIVAVRHGQTGPKVLLDAKRPFWALFPLATVKKAKRLLEASLAPTTASLCALDTKVPADGNSVLFPTLAIARSSSVRCNTHVLVALLAQK